MSTYRSLFLDESKLDISYVPHRLPHRDKELRLLTEFFSFLLRFPEKMSQRVLVVGDVGTGKTVLAQRFGADITHEAGKRPLNVRYVHVNCREYGGNFFLSLQHAVSAFHPSFPKRGYSAEELLWALVQMLDEEEAHLILALDEFDSLIEREGYEAVYKLTRVQEARQNKPQRLSLLCIMRSLATLNKLDASSRSTLQSNVINLEKYSKQQLVDILNDRVELAFRPASVPEDTVSMIAELAVSENGNARFGIELLWRAGKYASAEGLDMVTPECVRKAVSSVASTMRKSELASLGLHEKLFLLGIARLFKHEAKAFCSLSEAEQAYAVVCEEFGVKPVSHTQLWKYLKRLSSAQIVETKVSSSDTRGRSTLVCLQRVSAYELEKALLALLGKEAG